MIQRLKQTDSTNNILKQWLQEGRDLPEGFCLAADYQTAGRGQQGNGWESEQGKNLLFSLLLRPTHLKTAEQFLLTEVTTTAIKDAVEQQGCCLKIKWPNDIYADDRKIAGILIENASGTQNLVWSVIGVGLNVNQELFSSPAPNPVSLKQLIGRDSDLQQLLEEIINQTMTKYQMTFSNEGKKELHSQYVGSLYRFGEWHYYKECAVSNQPIQILTDSEGAFEGKITDVSTNGIISVVNRNNELKQFHFKEIKYIIKI